MLTDLKNTIRQSAVYGLSRISTKLIAFILLPFITLHLSVAEYGVYVLAESFWQILWAVYLFGLESGIVRWYLACENEIKRKRFIFSVFLFVLALNIILTFFVLIQIGNISELVFSSVSYKNLVLYSSLTATAETLLFIIFLMLRIEERAKLYTVFAILSSAISLVLQLYFLQYTNNKLEGMFIAKAIAPALIIIAMLPYLVKRIIPGIEKQMLKELLKYSFPVMAASLVMTMLNQVDRYFLGKFTNMDNVGIYGLASNISGLINFLIISPFSLAFTVLSWKKLNDINAKRFYTKTITYLFFGVIFISLGISLFTPHLIKIFTLRTGYWLASEYVPWIILAMPFYGIHFVGVFSFYITKNTKFVLYSYLTALIFKIIFDLILIPYYGIYGATIVNLISFFIMSLSIYIFSKKNYFFKYEWKKILIMIILYCACIIPFFTPNFNSRIIEIALKLLVFIMFPIILYLFRFYENIEIQYIKGFIVKYLLRKN